LIKRLLNQSLIILILSLLSQILSFIGIIYTAKFFSPESFGIYSTVLSVAAIFTVIFTAQIPYIMQKLTREIAVGLLESLCNKYIIAAIICSLLIILIELNAASTDLGFISLALYAFLLSFSSVCFTLQNSIFIRDEKAGVYGTLLFLRISFVVLFIAIATLYSSSIHVLFLSLVISEFTLYIFVRMLLLKDSKKSRIVLKEFFIKNKDYAFWGMIQDLTNAIAHSVPFLIFAYFFGSKELGFYALAYRILDSINSLLGNSVRMPLLRKMNQIKKDKYALSKLVKLSTILLVVISLLISMAIVFMQSEIMIPITSSIIDDQWMNSLPFLSILLPWFLIILMNIPFANLVRIVEKQRSLFAMNNIIVVVRIFTAFFVSFWLDNFVTAVLVFSLINVLLNILYIRKCNSIYYNEVVR
jgi:O-antigen/teichoic acid export membrane protein